MEDEHRRDRSGKRLYPWRTCQFCGCRTNALLRRCCDKGHDEDSSKHGPSATRKEGSGTPRNALTPALIEARVERLPWSGCWLWPNEAMNGYGKLGYRGSWIRAHRASWIAFNGDIPGGLLVLHKCDVKTCVNPDHLFLGTGRDNMLDLVNKGKWVGWSKSVPPRLRVGMACTRGHRIETDEDLYTHPSGGSQCRVCRSMLNRLNYQQRKGRQGEKEAHG
jgi:hypothetical protein